MLSAVRHWSSSTNLGIKSTIYALSSGFGKCGVAVIRVSGPRASAAMTSLSGAVPRPRVAKFTKLKHPTTKEVLDHGLVLWFPGPRSFTGEDTCEFQVHGGPAVVSSILSALSALPDCRPAEPGEFTKRAFYSGKLDLTAVEGLSDLINAETELQRRQALIQMDGALYHLYSKWSRRLTKLLANLEAYIDFDEGENLESELLSSTEIGIAELRNEIIKHLGDGRKGERLRDGINLTIIGAPNAGKSSLLNALSRKPTAIVSSVPGTTRDVILAHLDINGFPVNVMDTAGLRPETDDPIESEGMNRARNSIKTSDLIVFVVDGSLLNANGEVVDQVKSEAARMDLLHVLAKCENLSGIFGSGVSSGQRGLVVINKTDLMSDQMRFDGDVVGVSCSTEQGFGELTDALSRHLTALCGCPSSSSPSFTQARHRHCIESAVQALDRFTSNGPIDLATQEIRNALYNLGKITGHVSTEDILDVIFKDFCIGK